MPPESESTSLELWAPRGPGGAPRKRGHTGPNRQSASDQGRWPGDSKSATSSSTKGYQPHALGPVFEKLCQVVHAEGIIWFGRRD